MKKTITILAFLFAFATSLYCQQDTATYLQDSKSELKKEWPNNRTINHVFQGHSVPVGYFRTADVRTFDYYAFWVLKQLKEEYPTAVINVIVTSINGENSVQGERRFKKDVLPHRPDVLFIDIALNDKTIGKAWGKMIRKALKLHIKIILLTPSPSLNTKKYKIGLADSFAAFQKIPKEDLEKYMAQFNHTIKKDMNS
jgi:acyl-CoA thioesterase-1